MTAAERVVDIAGKEIGVTELPAGSNKVKYNTWFYGREVSGASYPWCCAFVCWVFYMAGQLQLLRKTGGCTTLMNWFKSKGRLIPAKEAKPGDFVFYQFDKDAYADHVGIVEKRTSTGIVAIEGNTSVTSQDNGGAVMRRTRRWSCIMAVARPDYESVKEENEMSEKEIQAMGDKAVDKAVKPLEEALAETIRAVYPASYHKVEELPEWARPVARRLMDAGIVKGDGAHEINLVNGAMNLGAAAALDKLRLEMVGRDA